MGLFRKKNVDQKKLYIEKIIKKYPRKERKKLRELYEDYQEGKMLFPENFDKNKVLNKE